MTDAHQFLTSLVVVATVGLLFASIWSVTSARRSHDRVDHRFAVDRLALLVVGVLAANGIVGLLLIAGGSRPADPLHLLYGPAALVTLPIGVWLSRRGGPSTGGTRRRDGWLLVAAIALVGIELRLVMTG